jgi:mannose-6-phosphate isomerase-like protein (cupin superfamily)
MRYWSGAGGPRTYARRPAWSPRSRTLANRPGGWRSPVGHLQDNQFAATNESKLPQVSRDFATKELPSSPLVVAPDGSSVRVLLDLPGGGLAQFTLPPGQTSQAVYHRTVEEIWFIVSGQGEMWRRLGKHDETVPLHAGVCLTIPVGTRFQFRSFGTDALTVVGVTMPPWPGGGEAVGCEGPWGPTLAPGPGLA